MKKNKLLHRRLLMRLCNVYILLAMGLQGILAMNTNAQSLRETDISLEKGTYRVQDLFKKIETQTAFDFTYYEDDIQLRSPYEITKNYHSLFDLLYDLSQEKQIKFNRINTSISVSKINDKGPKVRPQVMEQFQVRGTVFDDEGFPLPGASIVEKGTNNGTTSDFDGNFTIQLSDANGSVVVSYMGYSSAEIAVGGRESLEIILQPDAAGLDEVVVVGYGVQKKVNLSGAVDNISTEQLESRPISNMSQGLQGISPNLNITFNSGEPGQSSDINIRGITSINGGNPLILIDNVASTTEDLNRLSPEDVKDISVIKDASSAAIYGARAAFGVILVTTKSGTSGDPQFKYSSFVTMAKPTMMPNQIVDPYIYLRTQTTAWDNSPWPGSGNDIQSRLEWARQRSDDPSLPEVRENPLSPGQWQYMGATNWSEYFFDNPSFSQNHNISINGGSEKVRYFLSGSYNKTEGQIDFARDDFDRYGLRAKLDVDLTDWLTVGNNTYISSTKRTRPYHLTNTLIADVYVAEPVEVLRNPDGTWANTWAGRFGARLSDGGEYENVFNGIQTTFSGELRVIKDKLKVNADYTLRNDNGKENSFSTFYEIGFGENDIRQEGDTRAIRSSTEIDHKILNVYGTYQDQFGDHALTAILGFNQEEYRQEYFMANRLDIISPYLPSLELATGNQTVEESIGTYALRGAFYRLNYIYKDRYIFEVNGRYDGSSRFPKENRFGFFPSFSGAWNISQEDFMQSLNPTLNYLKLRASYGTLGNQGIDDYYGYIPYIDSYQGDYMIGGRITQEASAPSLVSSNYTWEEVVNKNIGLDVGLFNNKLSFNFDYYIRDTNGMLTLGRELPNVLGAQEPNENAADLRTKGWELSVNYRGSFDLADRPFNFDAKFVISDSKSKITQFDNPSGSLTQFYNGMDLGEIWGLTSDGFFQSEEEIAALDQSFINNWGGVFDEVVGTARYRDLNGDGAIDRGSVTVDDHGDYSVIGNFLPRYNFGLTLGGNWNGFDLNIFLQGVGKRDFYAQDYLYWGFFQQPYTGAYEHTMDYYRPTDDSPSQMAQHSQSYINAGYANANTDARFPLLQAWAADRNYNGSERVDDLYGLAIPQTRYLLDASYVRLRNITLGYSLPDTFLSSVGLKSLRFYVSADNIAEWSGVKDYFDPESITNYAQARLNPAQSISRNTGKGWVYPFQRKYAIGLTVGF